MKFLGFAIVMFMSVSSFASAYVKCGKSVSQENEVKGYVLELSSQDDNFNGPVGKNWSIKFKEDGEWIEKSSKITARTYKKNRITYVDVIVKIGQGATGPVGHKYTLKNLYSDNPTLEKYSMGGVVGTKLLAKYKCFTGND